MNRKVWSWNRVIAFISFFCGALAMDSTAQGGTLDTNCVYFGVPGNQVNDATITSEQNNGMNLRDAEFFWNAYEPSRGAYSASTIALLKQVIDKAVNHGWKVGLRPGFWYPPDWANNLPNARYKDQYGDAFTNTTNSGKNICNMVFNDSIRSIVATTLQHLFTDLGTAYVAKISLVDIGWGWYGETNYPDNSYNGHNNCYWYYDSTGRAKFSDAMKTKYTAIGSLNTSWGTAYTSFDQVIFNPGDASPNHVKAGDFINWYYDEMKDFVLWQYNEVRKYYSGYIDFLCGSWGVRPGQLDNAIAVDLNGTTSPEINGEVQRGFDFTRYIAALKTAGAQKISVHCTWIDSDPASEGPTNPCPAQWLAGLAHANGYIVGGEFAADGTRLSDASNRMIDNRFKYVYYVPESHLLGNQFPTLSDWNTFASGVRSKLCTGTAVVSEAFRPNREVKPVIHCFSTMENGIVEFYDISGKRITGISVNGISGPNGVTDNLKKIGRGVYLVRTMGEGYFALRTIVIAQ